MEENLDIRMENYLKLLMNAEFCKYLQLDGEAMMAMKQAVAIYAKTTAQKYVSDYNKTIQEQQQRDTTNNLLK